MTVTRWGDEELEVIRRMWAEGHTASHIANTLGEAGFHRSRSAVIGITYRLGFRRDVVPAKAAAPAPEALEPAKPKRPLKEVGGATANKKTPALPTRGVLPSKKPPAKKPPPAAPEPAPAPAPRPLAPAGGVALLDLEQWHCRRVVAEAPYRFCGEPKAFNTSWCAACAVRVFTPEGLERLTAGRKPPQRVRAAA